MTVEGEIVDEDVRREDVDPFELADRLRLTPRQGDHSEAIVGDIEAGVAERIGLEGSPADEAHGGGNDEVFHAAESPESVVGDYLKAFGEDEFLEVVEATQSRKGEVGVIAAAYHAAAILHGVAAGEALLEAEEARAVGGVAHAKGVEDRIFHIFGRGLIGDGDGASLGDLDRSEAAVVRLCEIFFHGVYCFVYISRSRLLTPIT